MIQHIALFSFNENTQEEVKEKLLRTLEQLPNYISQIKTFKLGKDFAKRQTCFEYGLIVEFANVQDLEIYLQHPIHVELLQRAIPYLGKFAEVDFKI